MRTPAGETAPYVHTDTSEAAAKSIEPHMGRLQVEVLDVIKRCGAHGATDDEIEFSTMLAHQTASARRRELVLKGKIKDSGDRRKTRSGRNAIVWVVA